MAKVYAERAVIESGGHQMIDPGAVEKVYYNPKSELDLRQIDAMTNATTLERHLYKLGVLGEIKPGGGEWLAEETGLGTRGDDYQETWRYFETPFVKTLLRSKGYDAIGFMDRERGQSHSAVMSLNGALVTWAEIQMAQGE
jgi:hypothetical protein